ncbi:MAG: hypothetical protein GF364_20255 [Candidatus Lokiarchaeota archaeon]|nr:hypothetical protein [Candidatus Lokiarchaeota archaeon]
MRIAIRIDIRIDIRIGGFLRFLADEMCGDICRWLRMLGYDTTYAKDYEDKYESPVSDDRLIDECFLQYRILITRDQEMYKKIDEKFEKWMAENKEEYAKYEINDKIITPQILLRTRKLVKSLKQIYAKFHIRAKYNANIARCTNCNAPLKLIKDKTTVKQKVPSKVYKYQDQFWQCTNQDCGKLYWQGTHFEQILDRIEAIKEPLSSE